MDQVFSFFLLLFCVEGVGKVEVFEDDVCLGGVQRTLGGSVEVFGCWVCVVIVWQVCFRVYVIFDMRILAIIVCVNSKLQSFALHCP